MDSCWDDIFFNGNRWNKCFDMFLKTKTHLQINLLSFVFKIWLSKVDSSKQIVLPQNVWISTCNFFNSVVSFLIEGHQRQREIIFKMLTVDSIKRRNTKKKEPKLQDTGLDLKEVTYGGPTFYTIKLLWKNGQKTFVWVNPCFTCYVKS